MTRFSLRTLFAFITIAALVLGLTARFVEQNRSDWKREQAAMLDGAVRWDEHTYIPNLDLEYTCTIPEWMVSWLPLEHGDIYYRVTSLNVRAGPANPADFERCRPFRDVDTIYLGSSVHDAPKLVSIFKEFPHLSYIHLDDEFDSSNTPITPLIKRELPGVQVIHSGTGR
jgi:hypothetical protein